MALSDYTPTLAWFADSLADLDIPTGTTKSNPGALTDPTIAGTPDAYADCSGSTAVNFLPVTPVMAVGTGDMTLVMKVRIDTYTSNDVLFSNYDGANVSPAAGMRVIITSGANRRVALEANGRAGFMCESASLALPAAGTDFIVAWRKSSGTWTMLADLDASGGMTSLTPLANNIGTTTFTECGDITIGSDRGGTGPTDMRLYWVVGFDVAIDDTNIQLADWDNEQNLKDAWLGAAPVVYLLPATHPLTNTRLRM